MKPQPVRTRRAPRSLLVLGLLSSMLILARAAPVRALPSRQSAELFTYKLVDRWTKVPWRLRPGHLREASDITFAPDGTGYVLDIEEQSVHVMDADGAWRDAFLLPGQAKPAQARQIDAGPDGTVYVLVHDNDGVGQSVIHLSRQGALLNRFVPVKQGNYRYWDLAVDPEGRVNLGRASRILTQNCTNRCSSACTYAIEFAGVDILDAQGVYLSTFGAEDLWIAGKLDIDPSGVVFVVNAAPRQEVCLPAGTPYPTATPRPSEHATGRVVAPRQPDRRPAADSQGADRQLSGVVVFGPDHRLRSAFPLAGVDPDNLASIGASAAGAYATRVRVYRITDTGLEPTYVPPGYAHTTGVTPDGRVLTDIEACDPHPAIGVNVWYPDGTTPVVTGVPDEPHLEGPVLPMRVAASRQLTVLQDLYWEPKVLRPPYFQVPASSYRYEGMDGQSIQRWPRRASAGAPIDPRSQFITCLSAANNGMNYPALDVASDGETAFTLAPAMIQRRPNDQLPDWTREFLRYVPNERRPHMTHLAAHRGQVAALDLGVAQVRMFDTGADSDTAWSYGSATTNAVPSDIALWADGLPDTHRVYLADRGRNRVAVYDAQGTRLAEWPTHDGPIGLAIGPTGDVFVLGRGGWGLRYSPEGALRAYWRMPDLKVEARDIAVDEDGIVYVAYAQVGPLVTSPSGGHEVLQGGIWLFDPVPVSAQYEFPPEPGRCLARADKSASPARLPLGDSVEVTLRVDGQCPGTAKAAQVALVIDTSYSMVWNNALARAKDAVNGLLAEMDPDLTEVALATFGDGAALRLALTRDLPEIASTLLGFEADGDTRMAAGIDIATTELTGARGRRDLRRVILLVSDGVPKDEPLVAAQAARQAGIEIYALIFPSGALTDAQTAYLKEMVGGEDHYLLNPTPDTVAAFSHALTRYTPEPGLFDTLTVTDVIPDNMSYVAGSAVPPATAVGKTLTWTLERVVVADPPVLRFQLIPQALGTWPTNVEAKADYVDVTGAKSRLMFPVPEVVVYAPPAIYLPVLANQACNPLPLPHDVVLALDTSESMREPDVHGGTKLEAVRVMALGFAELVRGDGHRVGIVSFNGQAKAEADLSNDLSLLSRRIGTLATGSGTRIDFGLREAQAMLTRGARADAGRVVIVLTDGRQSGDTADVLRAAAELHAAGVKVYSIGLGHDVDAALLRQVASSPQGYHASPTTEELTGITRQITAELRCRWP